MMHPRAAKSQEPGDMHTRPIRMVHLSDIHFGQERDGALVMHDDVRDELLNDCRAMQSAIGDADGVLVTGDIAYAGKKEEYIRASDWLDRLTTMAGCNRTSVQVIPGNHDVDLGAINRLTKMLHEQLRTLTMTEMHALLEDLVASSGDGHPLHKKLEAYREFAEQYGCGFESAGRPWCQREFEMGYGHVLRFVGLNSVQVSDKLDAPGNMVLGNTQYTIQRQDNVEYVIMSHHPLEWFKDRVPAKQFLHSRARILMFGHEHLAAIEKIEGENCERLIIDSGATNPPDGGNDYIYTYNWIELSVHAEGGVHILKTRIYPRVWVKSHTAFRADSTRMVLDSMESKVFELACSQFRTSSAGIPATSTDFSLTAGEEDAEGGMTMTNEDDEGFAQLRFFFWRYLDWRQRLKVLVDVDILPNSASRPVSQTMEKMALNTARAQGKLGALWDEIMNYVPEDARKANPFGPTGKKD